MIIAATAVAHVNAPSDTADAPNTDTNRVKGTQEREVTHTTTEEGAVTTTLEGTLVNVENVHNFNGTTQSVEYSHIRNKDMGSSRR